MEHSTPQEDKQLAAIIMQQCTPGALMSLGAHDFQRVASGLKFKAVILPFRKDGSRSEKPRKMDVEITLTWKDYYDVRVTYRKKTEEVLHWSGCDFTFDVLPKVCVALDFDGPEVMNPRIWAE